MPNPLRAFRRVRSQSLLAQARDDPRHFTRFYEEMYEPALAYFARRIFDPDTAFDLTAETFACTLRDLQSFRGETAEEGYAWFWAIARHQLWRWRERGRVEQSALRRLEIEPLPLTDVEFERAEELADLAERRDEIAAALEALPTDQRMAVQLRVIDECSYHEIAMRTGVSQQVVRARVSRGLRQLAREVRSEDVEIEGADP
jgi:RNA polymerase sigma-70 factor (ECF subfamily)